MRSTIFSVVMLLASATSALATVNVTSPANNSTVSSPVSYVATATSTCAKGVSAMGVYVDNVRMVVQNGANPLNRFSIGDWFASPHQFALEFILSRI